MKVGRREYNFIIHF
uniref:Uncharacterized protein n=1 Tax=Arundo donax TaxID=35708 RepID=A0A0A9C5L1_ARUDO